MNPRPTPVNQRPSVVNHQSSPVNNESTPVYHQSTVVNVRPSPVNVRSLAVKDESSVVNGQSSSVNGQSSPVNQRQSDVNGQSQVGNDRFSPANAHFQTLKRRKFTKNIRSLHPKIKCQREILAVFDNFYFVRSSNFSWLFLAKSQLKLELRTGNSELGTPNFLIKCPTFRRSSRSDIVSNCRELLPADFL